MVYKITLREIIGHIRKTNENMNNYKLRLSIHMVAIVIMGNIADYY